jgi:tRNA A37 N6-isopentenylltransferase MiaA
MEESKRQKQVARLIQEEMTAIFQKEGLSIIQGGNGLYFENSSNARPAGGENTP